ncbi:MAG TPA: DnaA N-terminal domain-containing protein [Candidatus Megaira endosymbiont of Nemacystus decipiens]|nr:DnaA N-terminal domain-containing protein [Candidatus Megaera endosymbiont of Nemacystus decipiens]
MDRSTAFVANKQQRNYAPNMGDMGGFVGQTRLPHLKRKSQLNKIITNASNGPDYLAINIYFDTLRSWYSKKNVYNKDGAVGSVTKLKTQGIYLRYKDLAETHGCSTETIRKKLVILEKLNLIKRSFQHKEKKSYNQLIVYVWKETPHFINDFGISKACIAKLEPQTNHLYIQNKYNITYNSKLGVSPENKANYGLQGIQHLEGTKELSNSFSYEKDRSIKSNFVEKKYKNIQIYKTPKKLNDFYPLSKTDCLNLQKLSGREFNLNSMNQILLSMSKRLPDRVFYCKKAFISYMSKAFSYEMRDAVKISDINFKIVANNTKEEQSRAEKEKYLSEIEYSLQVGPQWHFRKKIAAVFSADKAYEILTSLESLSIDNSKIILRLNKQIALSKLDQRELLSQAKASFEYMKNGEYKSIEEIEIKQMNKPLFCKKGSTKKAPIPKNVWGKVRELFINYLGEEGQGVDKNWLSKFKPEINTTEKRILLKAPSQFFKDWVESNYAHIIDNISNKLGFSIAGYEV